MTHTSMGSRAGAAKDLPADVEHSVSELLKEPWYVIRFEDPEAPPAIRDLEADELGAAIEELCDRYGEVDADSMFSKAWQKSVQYWLKHYQQAMEENDAAFVSSGLKDEYHADLLVKDLSIVRSIQKLLGMKQGRITKTAKAAVELSGSEVYDFVPLDHIGLFSHLVKGRVELKAAKTGPESDVHHYQVRTWFAQSKGIEREFDASVKHETEKALLLEISEVGEAWVPKSLIKTVEAVV